MSVSVILVSYNTEVLTIRAIECVYASIRNCRFPVDVLVVDNSSRDHSVASIKHKFPNVRLIESSTNLGFGAANNLALPLRIVSMYYCSTQMHSCNRNP